MNNPVTRKNRTDVWDSIMTDRIKPEKTRRAYFFKGILSIYFPEKEIKTAPPIVATAYIVPKPEFVSSKSDNQEGTNNEMKKVCPKDEKKLNRNPKINNLLFPLNTSNQSLISKILQIKFT